MTGNVSYDPENHDLMTRLRASEGGGDPRTTIPLLEVDDPDGAATPCSAGARPTARSRPPCAGFATMGTRSRPALPQPLPAQHGRGAARRYDKILVPEMNLGQLLKLVRAEFLVDAVGYNRVRGLPFKAAELEDAITAMGRS